MRSMPVSISPFEPLRGAPRLADGHPQVRRRSRGRVTSVTWSPVLLGMAISQPLSAANSLHADRALRGTVHQHDSWFVGCDNIAECEKNGFSQYATLDQAVFGLPPSKADFTTVESVPLEKKVNSGPNVRPYRFNLLHRSAIAPLHPLHASLRGERGLTVKGAPQRIPGTELIVSGFAPLFAAHKCGKDALREVRRYRFKDSSELWSYCCDRKDQQHKSYWEMVHADVHPHPDMHTTPLVLPEPRDGEV